VDQDVKLSRLFLVPVMSPPTLQPQPRLLTPGNLSVVSDKNRPGRANFDWSPDSHTIVFAHARTPRPDDWPSEDLSLVEVASGTLRPLVRTAAAESSPLYSPDGQSIAFTASNIPPTWAGKRTVQVVPASGGSPRRLADTQDGFGRYSELVGWSEGGDKLYFTEVLGANLKLLALPLDGPSIEISRVSGMSQGGVSLNQRRTHFGFGWEELARPPEAFVSAVAPFSPAAVSRVHRDLPAPPLGRTEAIRWKSTDGLEIEGLLTYPVGFAAGKRYPLLVVIHGGPTGVSRAVSFTSTTYPVDVWVPRGVLVLEPNYRGSAGYGEKFRRLNERNLGVGDAWDVLSGVDALVAKGWVDPAAAKELAALFEIAPVEVHEVLSFYNMFYTEPQGRHHVYVCTNVPCSLRGARSLLRGLEAYLGVHSGQTTKDGRITIGHEECLGSCGTAPVLRIDGTYHENVDFEDARRLVDGLE
jgi:NADH:ubiquinone oxidoreductase subunit E